MHLGFVCMHLLFLGLHMFHHLKLLYCLIFLNMLFVCILVRHIQILLHRIHFLRCLVLLVFLLHSDLLSLCILAIVFLHHCSYVLLLFETSCFLNKCILLRQRSLSSFLRLLLHQLCSFYHLFASLHLPIHHLPE